MLVCTHFGPGLDETNGSINSGGRLPLRRNAGRNEQGSRGPAGGREQYGRAQVPISFRDRRPDVVYQGERRTGLTIGRRRGGAAQAVLVVSCRWN